MRSYNIVIFISSERNSFLYVVTNMNRVRILDMSDKMDVVAVSIA